MEPKITPNILNEASKKIESNQYCYHSQWSIGINLGYVWTFLIHVRRGGKKKTKDKLNIYNTQVASKFLIQSFGIWPGISLLEL